MGAMDATCGNEYCGPAGVTFSEADLREIHSALERLPLASNGKIRRRIERWISHYGTEKGQNDG